MAEKSREERARKVVKSQGVKLQRFLPSGREIWTVVGSESDLLVVLPENGIKPYCACSDFHYRVLSGRVPECYHLLAAEAAKDEESYVVTEFSDEEMPRFARALVSDIFSRL